MHAFSCFRTYKGGVFFLSLISCALILAGCSEQRSKQFTVIGNTQLQLGNTQQAREAFEKALQIQPENGEAHLGLARCFVQENKDDEALKEYEQARRILPTSDAVYLEATNLLIRLAQWDTAREWATKYAEIQPERGGVLLAKIDALSGDFVNATQRMTTLREKYPNSALVRTFLAKLYVEQGKFAEAEQEIQEVLNSIEPDSLVAHMVRIEIYAHQNQAEKIVEDLEKLSQKYPDKPNIALALARALVAVGRVDDAQNVVTPIVEKNPTNGWANYILGECYYQKGEFEKAVQCLRAARHNLPDDQRIKELLAAAENRQPFFEQPRAAVPTPSPTLPARNLSDWELLWRQARLRELLNWGKEHESDSTEIREFLVAAALLLNRTAQAEEFVNTLSPDQPTHKLLVLLKQKNAEALFPFLETWSEDTPLRQDLRDNLVAYCYALAGRRAAALRTLSQSLQKRPDCFLPLFHSAIIFAQANMPEFQLATLKRFLTFCPENLDAQAALCETLWRLDRNEEALTQAQSLFAAFPEKPDVLRLLGRAYREVNDLENAANVLNKAFELAPNDAALRLQLAELETSKGNSSRALELLRDQTFPAGTQEAVNFLVAANNVSVKNWQEAAAIWEKRTKAQPSDRISLALRCMCASAYLELGNREEAKACLVPPENASQTYLEQTRLVRHFLGLKKENESLVQDTLLKTFQETASSVSSYLQVLGFIEGKIEYRAIPILEQLLQSAPESPALNSLMMRCISKLPRGAERLEKAQQLTERLPQNANLWLGLAKIAQKEEKIELERMSLDRALQLAPESPYALIMEADYWHRQRDYVKALNANRKLMKLLPTDPTIKNNVAYYLLKTDGDVQEAVRLAQEAVSQLPTHAEALHTLGVALYKAKKLDKAQQYLANALEFRPGDPQLLYDYGRVLMELGKSDEGKQHIALALVHAQQLALDFPEKEEAEMILKNKPSS